MGASQIVASMVVGMAKNSAYGKKCSVTAEIKIMWRSEMILMEWRALKIGKAKLRGAVCEVVM